MANTVFLGGTGVWTTAGNWDNGVPTGSNGAQIPGTVGVAIAGVDQSAVDTPYIYVDKGYNYSIGSDGAPLIIASADVRFLGGPTGKLFLKAGHATEDIDKLLIDCDNMTDGFQLSSDGTAQMLNIRIAKGKGTIAGSMITMPLLQVGYRTNPSSDVDLTIANGAGTVTLGIFEAGKISSYSAMTTCYNSGAQLTQEVGGGAISALYQSGGLTTLKAVQTYTTIVCTGGEIDMRNVPDEFTITNAYIRNPGKLRVHSLTTITNQFADDGAIITDATA